MSTIMSYPRKIVIENQKLKKLLEDNRDRIIIGRELSVEIDNLEAELQKTDAEIQKWEAKADLTSLQDRAEVITKQFNVAVQSMEDLKTEMYKLAKAKVPSKLYDKYAETTKLKEQKEKERNKTALKAQKIKDVITPMAQKIMKPHLESEYEDFYGLVIENGEVIGTIFSHLNDFQERFKKKQL